jgi:ComF family protein
MFNLSGIIAAAPHIGVYRQAVQALKYDGCSNLAEPLGFLMGEALIASRGLFPSCICSPSGGLPWLVPIPMHRDKELQRGYNQSRLLADRLGHSLRLKVKELLYRDKPGLTQAGLNKHQRLAALSEVFSCRTNAKPNNNCRKPLIILVDDVVTTGATLACCAGILRRVGYQQVIGLTFTAGSNQVIGQSKKM